MAGTNFVISSGMMNELHFFSANITVKSGGALSGGWALSCVTVLESGGRALDEGFGAGKVTMQPTALISGGSFYSSVTVSALSGATLTDCTMDSGVTVSCATGALVTGLTSNAGTIIGGTVAGVGSVETVTGSVQNQTVASGATIAVNSGGLIAGSVSLQEGASADLSGPVGGTVNLAGTSYATVTLSAGAMPTTLITGFNGASESLSDQIKIAGLVKGDIASVITGTDVLMLILKDGRILTLNVQGIQNTGVSVLETDDGITLVVCYLAGTRIETQEGVVPVEMLRVGDLISAVVDGKKELREIIWTGRGHCEVDTEKSDDYAGYPVCIRKNALGDNQPLRDLYVTSEHCLHIDGRFIPARMLVNGQTICYDRSQSSYDFFHFETRHHSIVIAEGVLSESYLDTGNRALFGAQAGSVPHEISRKTWVKDAAAPLGTDRAFVEPIYRKIASRINGNESFLPKTVSDADLYLQTECGQIIRAVRVAGAKHVFLLPSSARFVSIRSRASRPCDVIGPFVDDRRTLGVRVGQVLLFVAGRIVECRQHLEPSEICGWHSYEGNTSRWTNGEGFLSLEESMGDELRLLSLELLEAGPYLDVKGVTGAQSYLNAV
ncbi:Hint domain-containing protein [Asaia spathodeae]|uniref:Hint domain-containing protein n=1 Tax=Asaia spathodeae TaxID=657016 RepID=A0ABX2P2S5_9PROT|nr:Hint domain-containing protein [Asaia spathodeae]GBR18309.1 hypothetical protein AA105894_2037 [Asaia spathodeae NBRC 105894]